MVGQMNAEPAMAPDAGRYSSQIKKSIKKDNKPNNEEHNQDPDSEGLSSSADAIHNSNIDGGAPPTSSSRSNTTTPDKKSKNKNLRWLLVRCHFLLLQREIAN